MLEYTRITLLDYDDLTQERRLRSVNCLKCSRLNSPSDNRLVVKVFIFGSSKQSVTLNAPNCSKKARRGRQSAI